MMNLFLLSRLYFRQVWREIPFLIIVGCGLGLLVAFVLMTRGAYESQVLPFTFEVTDIFRRFQPALWAILLLFGGEQSARERNAGISPLLDVLPYSTGSRLTAQVMAMHGVAISLLILMMCTGLLTQALSGFYQFNLPLYFQVSFLEIMLNTSFMIALGFFIHTLVHQRFAGHIIIILLILVRSYLPAWGLELPLFHFGGLTFGRYSDLTGFAPGSATQFWHYAAYWLGLALLLFCLSRLMVVRGIETGLKTRLRLLAKRLSKASLIGVLTGFILFLATGTLIYIESTVKNEFYTLKKLRAYRAQYEIKLKAYEKLPSLQITDVRLDVALFPEQDRYELSGTYNLVNPWSEPIHQVFVQGNLNPKVNTHSIHFSARSKPVNTFEDYQAVVYEFETPLLPGDSQQMHFKVDYSSAALAQVVPEDLTQTASFFTNDQLPGLGYNKANELKSPARRAQYNLAPKDRELPQSDRSGYLMGINQAHSINYEATISTPAKYFAGSSGDLVKEWSEDGRNYFQYASKEPIENQFMIVTGQWSLQERLLVQAEDSIRLRLRHHAQHDFQAGFMLDAMEQSMAYYSQQFSAYQYHQLNLFEVTRAHEFAMSVPNTIAYSEALGFTTVAKDSVIPYFITAHEVAHQWWGDQVRAARVKGESMIVETLSQYSAGAVTRSHLGKDAFQKVLRYERGRYLRRRKQEVQKEQPLVLAEDQAYIHYGKGLLNMMALRHYIGEDSLNSALKRFAKDFPASENKYPNSRDLISEIRNSTPDSLQYLVTDLFEKITFWDGRIQQANVSPGTSGYELNAQLFLQKLVSEDEGLLKETAVADWVEIAVFGLNERGEEKELYRKMHRFNQPELNLTLRFSEQPYRIVLDPDHLLMDRNIDDNALNL